MSRRDAMTAAKHRSLLDRETLLERTCVVTVIAEALRHERHLWGQDDETRRAFACRIAFMLWAIRNGEINDAI